MGMDPSPVEIKAELKGGADMPKIVSVLFKVILGLVLLILGIAAMIVWRNDLLALIRGGVGPFLILAGLVILIIARE
jgi:hypothetical protein